jgi:predicted nucleic acid-binding protein
MGLSKDLLAGIPEGSLITLDTAPIIYYLQDHPVFAAKFDPLFEAAAAGKIHIVISSITLAEVLCGPLATGNELLASQYRAVLSGSPGWQVLPVDEELAVSAARLRSRYKIRLPDAIQVATAIQTRSYALVTHDRALRKIRDVKVIGIGP